MITRLVTLLAVLCCFSFSSKAQEYTGNILDNNNWSGSVTPCSSSACWGGLSGGQTPSWNGSVFRWGYGGGTVHQQIAINQVFNEMGINVLGFYYHWHIKNYNANTQSGSAQDPLDIAVKLYGDDGSILEEYNFDYGYPISDWRHFAGTEYFTDSYLADDLGYIQLSATGDDAGYWAGWYGPEWQPIDFRLVYEVDPCIANPLSSTSCEGYAEAYYDQQCSQDALYDQGCTGYAEAYYNQQCSFDALYDSGCPGYEEAYYEQQCSIDALYDIGCPGYKEAYYFYQCSLDALYDQGCDGYAMAFEEQQCQFDPQYSPTCPGYQFPSTPTVQEETVIVVVEEEPVQEPIEEQMGVEVIEEEYVEVIEPLTKEEEKENAGESKSDSPSSEEQTTKSNSRRREGALRIGLGVSDRLVAGLISSSISSGDASAEESQQMNQMLQSDNEAFSQLSQSSSTSTTDDNNSVAGVGPVVVVIIPPESSGGDTTEKQESLAERLAEKVRQANLEKSATYKGQTAMLQNINNAVDLSAYDKVLTDRDEIYVMSQIYPNNVMKTNNGNHYRLKKQSYGVMREMIRSQY